jgi:hypothetical protein
MNLDQHTVGYADGAGFVTFPQLAAWTAADPTTDAETFRGTTLSEMLRALSLARARIAIALAILDPSFAVGADAPMSAWADLDGVTLYLDGTAAATRRRLADAFTQASEYLRVTVDASLAQRDAADVFATRQQHGRRLDAFEERVHALAGGDPVSVADIRRQCPDPLRDLDAAEAALDRFEAEVRAQTIARTAGRLSLAHDPRHDEHPMSTTTPATEGTAHAHE